jgi:hypothetical protein
LVLGVAHRAHADARGEVEKKIKEAMESYDGMDYDAAKKLLTQAIATARKGKLDKDPVAAKAYLDLGIVAFANNDAASAKVSFASAAQIQPRIQIDPAYKSPELAKLLDEARGDGKGGGGDSNFGASADSAPSGSESGDCGGIRGLQHELIDTAKAGSALKVEASLGSDVHATKVSVMFRPEGATEFTEVKMAQQGCKYVGTIPASGMRGSLVHYYVAAFGQNGKPVAAKGSAGSPNIMELSGGGGGGLAKAGDDEDPLSKKTKSKDKPKDAPKVAQADAGDASGTESNGGDVSASASVSGKPSKFFLAASVGMGFGYLAAMDQTEAGNSIGSGGFGKSLVVFTPELMYAVTPHIAIGAAARLGLPVDANVAHHQPVGPAGMARVRYALSPSGDGIRLMAEVGYGILRNTVSLSNSPSGMNMDVVALGPLVVGGGGEYAKKLTDKALFIVSGTVVGGFAFGGSTNAMGNSTLTGAPINNGVGFDLSLGVAYGL